MLEPQEIYERVVVVAAPYTRNDVRDGNDVPSAEASRTTALQLTAASSSLDAVAFRADFDCEVFPFERRVLALVVREPTKRAFVRVRYDSVRARALAVSEIEQAQQTAERTLRHAIDESLATYCANRASDHVELSRAPWFITQRHCDAINRFFASRDGAVCFVDASFPPTATSLCGMNDDDEDASADAALYALSTWRHLHDILESDASWTLVRSSGNCTVTTLQSPLPGHDSLLCALAFVAFDKTHWLKQLLPTLSTQGDSVCFKDSRALQDVAAITVRLCDRGMRWTRVLIDLYAPSFPLGRGLMGAASLLDGELYPMLLQKAYAKLHGGYYAIRTVSTLTILRELTGLPWVTAYRSSRTDAETASESELATQTALQRLLCRRPRRSHKLDTRSPRFVFVVSFGGVHRSHHCAFPILRADAARGVELLDVTGAIAAAAPMSVDEGDGRSTSRGVALSWSAFFALNPDVSMLLANHTEARRQRIVFVHPALATDSAQALQHHVIEFALSVAELTSVVVSTQVEQRTGGASCRHALTLGAVGADYSLTRVPTDAVSTGSKASGGEESSDLQLVIALGAGEYVLSAAIDAPRTPRRPLQKTSIDDTDTMLALLFDAIDADMDGAISHSELQTFLETHESDAFVSERLATFFKRFGRASGDDAAQQLLLLEDLRDVYESLVTGDPLVSNDDDQQQRRALNALVRSDVRHALGIMTEDDAIATDALVELRCSVHSDVPLIGIERLPPSATAASRARAS